MDEERERLCELARGLGALQEARRLGSRVVGTEHLLIATLAEPGVRRALLDVGCRLRDVQVAVSAISDGRENGSDGELADLTPETAALLRRVASTTSGMTAGGPSDVQAVSRALRAIMIELLTHDGDSAARRVLVELDVIALAPDLVASIELAGDGTQAPQPTAGHMQDPAERTPRDWY